jgi:hypothetical protein
LMNVEVVKKLGLTTREHPHPYHIQWFNNNGKVKVTKQQGYIFQLDLTMTLLILMWCLCMLALFCWDILGSLILMLFTMVDLISVLSCITARKIMLLTMTPTEIVQFENEKKTKSATY